MVQINFDGIFVPLITPLNADETLDEDSLSKLVEYVIAGGVQGIFVLGSSGEGPTLPTGTKVQLVRSVNQFVCGRVPVLVGAFEASTRRVITFAKELLQAGGDAVVVTAPYYFTYTQEELLHHFTAVSAALPVPVILYNIPQMVKTVLEPETVVNLSRIPNIIGVKDSLGDMARFQRLLPIRQERPDFGIHQGAEGVAAISIARGATGATLGLSNIAPSLCVELHRASCCGDLETAWKLQERLQRLWQLHSHAPWLPCLKAAASLLGLCQPYTTEPFAALSPETLEAIREDLSVIGL
ncbi:MAG TPA: dihydrodipicolinate synthase family protein [Anaerolineaceae bacterium]